MNRFYKCIKCKQTYPFSRNIINCPKHSPYYGYLTLEYNYSKATLYRPDSHPWGRYKDLLPITNFKINFNEQKTPLITLKNLGKALLIENLYVKDESKNPTGSFKDKESICVINKALEWKIKQVFTVSSGNAAVSTAAYAQKGEISCECLVPTTLSDGKKKLISIYGGELTIRKGSYEDIYRYAIDKKLKGWNCTPGLNPIKEEGLKIIGWEIWEEIGVPDVIIVPCGNGTLLYGIYKAFQELIYLKLATKLPILIGVQIKGAAPLAQAFRQKKDYIKLPEVVDSIAEGIVAQESYSSPKVILALNQTKGFIVEVTDRQIEKALKEIIQLESLIPEPTSAVVYAALRQIKNLNNQRTVLIQTAGGSKNLAEIYSLISSD